MNTFKESNIPQTPAISFEKVTKRYGLLVAVDDLTFSLQPGELFGFLGPNGAGKTTAMKIAAGLVKPTSGSVFISGHDVQKQPLEAKRLIGYVPDNPYVYESLTGREYLHFSAGLYKLDSSTATQMIEKLSESFGIGEWIDKRAAEYSHGMKQRVVMASAFLHEPRIVLIDEPMVGLDPIATRMVKKVMREFCSAGGTLFFSTHTISTAEELCNKVGIIHWGKLIACGTLDELPRKTGGLEEAFFALTSETDKQ